MKDLLIMDTVRVIIDKLFLYGSVLPFNEGINLFYTPYGVCLCIMVHYTLMSHMYFKFFRPR